MKDVKYFAPTSLAEALGLLKEYSGRATLLAGGTDLVPKINYYDISPEVLLYIGGIDLAYIKEEGGAILIGAGTSTAELAASELLKAKATALYQAAGLSGSVEVRNSATIGGNLANASPAADLATPLLVMDAELKLAGPNGTRTVPSAEFFKGPGKTALGADEILVEVAIPVPQGRTVFKKLGRRKAMTLSVVNVAVLLAMDGGQVGRARIALGAMAPTPLRCVGAESLLAGKKPDQAVIKECAAKAVSETSPIDDQRASAWYRQQAGQAMVVKALAEATGLSG